MWNRLKTSRIRQTVRQVGLTLLFLALGLEVILVSPERVSSEEITRLDQAHGSVPNGEGAQHILTGVHLVEANESDKEWSCGLSPPWATMPRRFGS